MEPGKEQAIRKERMPRATAKYDFGNEVRVDLPFHRNFDSLSYIGINACETWTVSQHYHEHFELCYIDEGRGWFSIDSQLYQVQQGDLFLTKPGENHQGAAAGDGPYRLYYLGFKLTGLVALEEDFYRIGQGKAVVAAGPAIKSLFDGIMDEIAAERRHAPLLSQSLFVQLLVETARTYREHEHTDEAAKGGNMSPVVKELLESLHEQVGIQVRINELASRHHLSRTHLEREFKRSVGIPLGKYMRSLCMERAKFWLQQPDQSVTGVSELLGFATIHSFSMFFKRNSGQSPQEYRNQMLKPNDEKR